jgi:hypothetical protein
VKVLFLYKVPITISDTQLGDKIFHASKLQGEVWKAVGMFTIQGDDTDAKINICTSLNIISHKLVPKLRIYEAFLHSPYVFLAYFLIQHRRHIYFYPFLIVFSHIKQFVIFLAYGGMGGLRGRA